MDYKKKIEELLRDDTIPEEQRKKLEEILLSAKISEDEKIRKALIKYFSEGREYLSLIPYNKEQCVAWLEKQDEQKSVNDTDEDIAKAVKDTSILDMAEPKFKVGNWIVFNGLTLYVKEVVKGFYRTISKDGITNSYDWDIDNVARLWTIQDAKDGDILAAHECYVIFKEIDGLNIKCHCTYHYMGFNPSFHISTLQNKTAFQPATKEQSDILMKAMADAGYTFVFGKKELKKIEHDIQLTEFEDAVKDMMDDYRDVVGGNDVTIEEVKKHAAYLLSLIHQNLVNWSEEDEDMIQALNACIDAVIKSGMNYISFDSKSILIGKVKNWLKSLECKVRQQPKRQWTEKDEKIRQTIINEFEQCSEWYCSNGLTKEDCINWLNKQEYFEWGDEDNENMNSLCVLLDQMVSINAIGNEHSIEYKNWLRTLKDRVLKN